MVELKRAGEFGLDFIPQAPDAEVLMLGADIVQQNYAARPYFGQSCPENVTDSLVGVEPIDVQRPIEASSNCDIASSKLARSRVRELPIVSRVVLLDFLKTSSP